MIFLILWLFILGTILLVYLYYPFLKSNQAFPEIDPVEELKQTLAIEREQSYTALADLDEDFETGKLSIQDYQKMRAELLQETANIVSQLEAAADIDVESEIEKYKQQRQG
ncbi:hypothetical protein F4X73_14270 [Candidatus Poribacteria bacterium]|nr:hypothetical protein [Candidatus Poribacteria bacterium]MYB65851.1 hypothetical protein [Candidatus Poribacteria bacterium]MYF54969.1 hypothetical protein [Candidatus Poribacteria bacterium]